MLNDFTWNMTGYIPKHQVNPSDNSIIPYVAERIFQLEPEPPKVDSLNEYILSALQEKNLLYFSFFLHHYEPQLNKRIKDLSRRGWRRSVRHRPFSGYKAILPGTNAPEADGLRSRQGCGVCHLHFSVHPGCYAPFPHGRRKMVGVISDQLQNGAVNGMAVP